MGGSGRGEIHTGDVTLSLLSPYQPLCLNMKGFVRGLVLVFAFWPFCFGIPTISDQSVRGYLTERTCWWNEVCKEEFQTQFKCKCPLWSFCRSEGRYYSAYCSMTNTGYIWAQPDRSWASAVQTRAVRLNKPR